MKAVILIRGGVLQTTYRDNPALAIVRVNHNDRSSLLRSEVGVVQEAAAGMTRVY
jgi:hypothetical protein